MPSVSVKLYSLLFKFILKNRLQKIQNAHCDADHFGISTRPEEPVAPPNPSFTDGVATKDIHIDPCTSLSVRIFLPDSALHSPDPKRLSPKHFKYDPSLTRRPQSNANLSHESLKTLRRKSFNPSTKPSESHIERRNSSDAMQGTSYKGYLPDVKHSKRLPVILQFHGGGWVSGSNVSTSNDLFCRRIAKLCDVVILAVGYRLAPDDKFPAAFDDGVKVLRWLAKQMNLAECGTSMLRKRETRGHIVDGFGASTVEPWLAGHVDPTRCVLLGGSCGANIADFVARKAVEMGKRLDPVKIVAQVLMCPFFIGSVPTQSEMKLANSYFYDKATCLLAWKLFLPEEEYSLDHPAGNPLGGDRGVSLRDMPPTLTVVAEHDWMRDRAIAYSEEMRKAKVDAPVLEYKDAVHEFATLDVLLRTPQAQACAEDISIWVKKYISLRGHEFSY